MGFVVIPHHFAPGTAQTILAAQLNANFAALAGHYNSQSGNHFAGAYGEPGISAVHQTALQEAIARPGPFFVEGADGRIGYHNVPGGIIRESLAELKRPTPVLHVPVQVPPPAPYVPPPPPPRDPWEGHDGKDAAGFAIAWAMQEPALPDGWREPTWRDLVDVDMNAIPGWKPSLRIPGIPPMTAQQRIIALGCSVSAAMNVPLGLTGHVFNDFAALCAACAGVAVVVAAKKSAQAHAGRLS